MVFKDEAGRYAKPRPGGGLVNVTFDAREMIRLADLVRGETKMIAVATKVAHKALAQELQKDIAKVLEDKVDARGRLQGMSRSGRGGVKSQNQRLGNAILSEENRRTNEQGFTVGYLDQIEAVAKYYRGLEEGSVRHKGRFLSGVFLPGGVGYSRSGATRGVMVAGGADGRFTQAPKGSSKGFHYGEKRPYSPGVRIKHGITGYRYFQGGQRAFLARGGDRGLAVRAYQEAFKASGVDLLSRSLSGRESLPTVTGYTSQR